MTSIPPLRTAVGDMLATRGGEFAGESTTPARVALEQDGTAVIATLDFHRRSCRFVVKKNARRTGIRSPFQLANAISTIRHAHPTLAQALPTVRGIDEGLEVIVLDWVDGVPLSLQVRHELAAGKSNAAALVSHAGDLLSRIHSLDPVKIVPDCRAREIGAFLPSFRQYAAPFERAFSDGGFGSVAEFLTQFSDGFLVAPGSALLLVDSRPKNTIMRVDGSLCFIDIDCEPAPLGLAISGFLVAMDREGSRYTATTQQHRLTLLQRAFLSGYGTAPDVVDHVAFFYPWALTVNFDQHRRVHPHLYRWLHRYYELRLRRFLKALNRLRQRRATDVRLLFEDPLGEPAGPLFQMMGTAGALLSRFA